MTVALLLMLSVDPTCSESLIVQLDPVSCMLTVPLPMMPDLELTVAPAEMLSVPWPCRPTLSVFDVVQFEFWP